MSRMYTPYMVGFEDEVLDACVDFLDCPTLVRLCLTVGGTSGGSHGILIVVHRLGKLVGMRCHSIPHSAVASDVYAQGTYLSKFTQAPLCEREVTMTA